MAYHADKAKATRADNLLATANSIKESGFTVGTVKQFTTSMEEAGYYGSPEAISELCSFNSNEMLGIAFFRKAYVWCNIAIHTAIPGDARKNLAFVIAKLGPESMPVALDYETYALQKIQGKIDE
jgi:hypothetical protein